MRYKEEKYVLLIVAQNILHIIIIGKVVGGFISMKKEVSLKKGLKVPMYLFSLKKGQRRNITNIDILILALIYTFSDKESKCYLTNTEIANLLDISKVQVSDRLHYLDKNKYLAIIQNNKKGRTLFIPSSLKEDITKSFSEEYKFLFIPSEIFNLKTISLSEKFILSYIVGFCKSGKLCKTSKKKLYKWFNISENTLKRAVIKFKKLDLIETTNITNSFNRDCGREIKLNLDNLKAFYINEAQIYKAKIENVENAKVIAKEMKVAKSKDAIIITCGEEKHKGGANLIKISEI